MSSRALDWLHETIDRRVAELQAEIASATRSIAAREAENDRATARMQASEQAVNELRALRDSIGGAA
jgi:hypothetical protein